jgi:hypothetical protein
MKQYDDRSSREACAKEGQLSNPTCAVVQAIPQNVIHLGSTQQVASSGKRKSTSTCFRDACDGKAHPYHNAGTGSFHLNRANSSAPLNECRLSLTERLRRKT